MINIEVTDTFGGQANYCWVNRYTMPDTKVPLTDLQVVRRAKALAGWNGTRTKTYNYGDLIELRPYGACQVMFITFDW